jgi:uncharacterized protein (TIGR03790 family)
MRHPRLRSLLGAGLLWLGCALGWEVQAGGSGLNVVVIANQASSNSCELANYFCEHRAVPPDNLLRITWAGSNISWTSNDFQVSLLTPLLNMLSSRQLTNQIDYLVLSMDIPFQTVNPADGTVNGTTAALFYGLRAGGGGPTNSYAASESVFSQAKPLGAPGSSFLATMLTGDSLAHAEQVVDQGVASDGTFPLPPVVLAKSSDSVRNLRYSAFDNASFNVGICGASSILRTNSDTLPSQTPFLGYETGLAVYSVPPNAFVPGAMADSLTSYGGILFGVTGQTSLLAMLNAGAAGSYGTVAEPGTDTQKFPDPQLYFYQARGFNLAECYYQSIDIPFLGLVAGEPLAAPFQEKGAGTWQVTNTVFSATAQLPVFFYGHDGSHPLQQLDLFLDDKYVSTRLNLAPSPGNRVTMLLNGYPISYTVPANATLGSVAAALAGALNAPAVTNLTQVTAYPHGDRIELHSNATNFSGPFFFTDPTATNAVPPYRTVFLPTSFPPQLTVAGRDRSGVPRLQIETLPNEPFVILGSSNLVTWFPVFSSSSGGPVNFVEPGAAAYSRRFYRVSTPATTSWLGPGLPPANSPAVSVLSGPGSGGATLQIEASVWPYMVQAWTSSNQWTSLFTNLEVGEIQTAVQNSVGNANALTTFLVASGSRLMKSTAYGYRQYKVPSSSLPLGAWLGLTLTTTNGASVFIGVTNQTSGGSSTNLTGQLCNLVNATPGLQGSDGVVAEDFTVNGANLASFNLRARSPGLQAAAIQALPWHYMITILPSSQGSLNQNLSDLQPRGHIYVTAGATTLGQTVMLDTTTLADGYHELAAVAYEGSAVHTQTRATLPLQIQNTPLTASLTLLDLTNNAPAPRLYHLQVAANTNRVSLIRLFSTGGMLAAATNQPTATFTVDGSLLGAGLHRFYALVDTLDGLEYRTRKQSVRLTEGP